MQLKSNASITPWMSAAATTLLASSPLQTQAAPAENQWEVDAAILYYGEIDRVTAIEPIVQVRRNWSAEESLTGTFTFDTLSGASHNGAAVVDSVQTFTGPSGQETDDDHEGGPQTFQPGELPIIEGYEEGRLAFDLAYTAPFKNPLNTYSIGTTTSIEGDYFSTGLNGGLSWELNQRNTILSVGAASSFDIMYPKGGLPKAYETYDAESARKIEGIDTKQTLDLNVGVTQILNRTNIAQINYGVGWILGYQNDPYKIVSLLNNSNEPVDYINESRPDSRMKQSVRLALKTALGPHSLTSDYRFYWDDWSVTSHTLDQKLRIKLPDTWFVEGHGRWYMQSKADFFQQSWSSEQALPSNLSADHRLGTLFTQTYGFTTGFDITEGQQISFRAEWYNQRDPDTNNKAADMTAIIGQLNYGLKF